MKASSSCNHDFSISNIASNSAVSVSFKVLYTAFHFIALVLWPATGLFWLISGCSRQLFFGAKKLLKTWCMLPAESQTTDRRVYWLAGEPLTISCNVNRTMGSKMWLCLKPALFLMASREWLHWLLMEKKFFVSLCENDPAPHLLYNLSEQFPDKFMV